MCESKATLPIFHYISLRNGLGTNVFCFRKFEKKLCKNAFFGKYVGNQRKIGAKKEQVSKLFLFYDELSPAWYLEDSKSWIKNPLLRLINLYFSHHISAYN